jgi:hypothetical protein
MVADEAHRSGEPLLRGAIGVGGPLRRSERDDFDRYLGPSRDGAGYPRGSFFLDAHEV